MADNENTQKGTDLKELSKTPTGIDGLDEITHGGFPRGRPIIVCGNTGCGKTLLAMQFLVKGAVDYGEPGVFIAFDESEIDLCRNVASFGWNIPELQQNKQLLIDQVKVDRAMLKETGDFNLEGIFLRLGSAIEEIGAKRVVLDTIEAIFIGLTNTSIIRAELHRLFQWLKKKGVTTIITVEREGKGLSRYGVEEYVSDCVLLLDNRIENEIATRRMWIVKYRGSIHGSNEYPFLITTDGFSVLPITSLTMDYVASDERISSGIPRLNTMLDGKGYFRGSSVMVSGNPGSGKSTMALHFIQAACQRGERCLVFSFEESPSQIIRNMRSVGLEIERFIDEGLLSFHCTRTGSYGLEMHLAIIHEKTTQFQPRNIVFDPINGMTGEINSSQTKSFLTRIIAFLKSKEITTLFVNLESDDRSRFVGISSIMDTWIRCINDIVNGELNRVLYLMKSRGMAHSNQAREFFITKQGIKLEDIYVGPEGMVTGSARKTVEAKEKAAVLQRWQEIEKLEIILSNKEKNFESQLQSLKIKQDIEKKEFETRIAQANLEAEVLLLNRGSIGKLRGEDND